MSYDDAYNKMKDAINRRRSKEAAARSLPRNYWKKASFQGVSDYEFRIAAKAMKVIVKWQAKRKKGTLRGWATGQYTMLTFVREHTVKDRVYVLVAGHHYVVVLNGIVYDNTSDGPHPVESYPRAKLGRVRTFAEVRPRPAAFEPEEAALAVAA